MIPFLQTSVLRSCRRLLLCAATLLVAHGALAEERHALVMGVWDYDDPTFPPLPQSGIEADINKISAKLAELGFQVKTVANPTLRQAKQAVDEFGTLIKSQPGTALFYFSGHGSEFDGKNFLIPKGTQIVSNRDLDDEALSANRVLDRMEDSGGKVNIVFLDCCRNSLSKGGGDLASMEANGTFIGYATRGGKVSSASLEGSLYTASLLKHLGTPGVSITDMHTMVTREVKAMDPGQVPHQYSGLDQLFFFKPGAPGSTPPMEVARMAPSGPGSLAGLSTIGNTLSVAKFKVGFHHRNALGNAVRPSQLPEKVETFPDYINFPGRDLVMFDADPWRVTTVGENSRTVVEFIPVPKAFKDDPGAADEDPGFMSRKTKQDAVTAVEDIYNARSLQVKGRRFVDHSLSFVMGASASPPPGKVPMGFWWGGPDYQRDSVAPYYIESADGAWRGIARFINSGQDYALSPFWQAVVMAKDATGSIIAVVEVPVEETPEFGTYRKYFSQAQDEGGYSKAMNAAYAFLGNRPQWENGTLGQAVKDGEAIVRSLVLKP